MGMGVVGRSWGIGVLNTGNRELAMVIAWQSMEGVNGVGCGNVKGPVQSLTVEFGGRWWGRIISCRSQGNGTQTVNEEEWKESHTNMWQEVLNVHPPPPQRRSGGGNNRR